jgi:arylsulfatase A-like enzyme
LVTALHGVRLLVSIGAALLSLSCARDDGPVWGDVLESAAAGRVETPAPIGVAYGSRRASIRFEGDEAWIEARIRPGDWQPESELWRTRVDLRGHGRPAEGAPPLHLSNEKRSYRYHSLTTSFGDPSQLESGSFALMTSPFEDRVVPEALYLRTDDGERPPEDLVLSIYAGRSLSADGDIVGRRFSGNGIPLWPGQRLEFEISLPPRSALRFATTVEPIVAAGAGASRPIFFRVFLDDSALYEYMAPDASAEAAMWHEVALPESGGPVRLALEVSGPAARTVFFAPSLGPHDAGGYGRRPWESQKPDIVVFLADTFRADNMSTYGGAPGLTPHLDAFATRSLAFLRSWSVSTYTTASHAAIFSGQYPRQTGATSVVRGMSPRIHTIAERLAEVGYRTGAITDSVVVSAQFGLSQGFEWFDEHQTSIESSVERALAFLDVDDGRPVFLFVQSYRAHAPYRTTPRSRRAAGIDESSPAESMTLQRRLQQLRAANAPAQEIAEVAQEFERYYRAGASDLDAGFGVFLAALEERGVLNNGYLIFTSDHGEAFGEHDSYFHNLPVWEELTRVPLLIHGPGIDPGPTDFAASGIDLAPTLAALAGLAEEPQWPGTSLVDLAADRPVFLFQSHDTPDSTAAIVEGARKVHFRELAPTPSLEDVTAAYDLDADPREARDRAADATWPEELLRRYVDRVIEYRENLISSEAPTLAPDQIEQLRAMGYIDD